MDLKVKQLPHYQKRTVVQSAHSICKPKAKKIKTEYRKNLLSKTVSVLFENKTKVENMYFGRDQYFNSVITESREDLTGKIKNINISKVSQNTLFGEINLSQSREDFAA